MNQAQDKCCNTVGVFGAKQALMAAIMHQGKAAAQEKNKQKRIRTLNVLSMNLETLLEQKRDIKTFNEDRK